MLCSTTGRTKVILLPCWGQTVNSNVNRLSEALNKRWRDQDKSLSEICTFIVYSLANVQPPPYVCTYVHVCLYVCTVRPRLSVYTSDIQFPHLLQYFLLEQICNNPTVHYTTTPSFILSPDCICYFIQNTCVRISEL